MSHHIFNNLAKLLDGDLAAKIGWGILSQDLMDRECNCPLQSKVNVKSVYKDRCRVKYVIHKVKCSMGEAIYIGNIQQTLMKRMDGHLSDILRLLKKRKKFRFICCPF